MSSDATASFTSTVGGVSSEATASFTSTVGAASAEVTVSSWSSILFVISSVNPTFVSEDTSFDLFIKSSEDKGSLFSYNFSEPGCTLLSKEGSVGIGFWLTSFETGGTFVSALMKGTTYFWRAISISVLRFFIRVSQFCIS